MHRHGSDARDKWTQTAKVRSKVSYRLLGPTGMILPWRLAIDNGSTPHVANNFDLYCAFLLREQPFPNWATSIEGLFLLVKYFRSDL